MSILKERKRTRLQTLARALTDANSILVHFGSGFHTDLTAITVRDLDQDECIVPGVPASKAERWVAIKAGCAHEAGHILFTDKSAWEEAVSRGPLFQNIVNILEDARVERATANAYPGTLLWFRFANEYIARHRTDWGEGANAFLGGLCAYAVAGVVPDALGPEEKSLIEKCRPFVDRARVLGDTWGVLRQAEEIHKLAEATYPGVSVPPPPPMPGTSTPRPALEGPLDPRRVREPEPGKPPEKAPEGSEMEPEGKPGDSEQKEPSSDPKTKEPEADGSGPEPEGSDPGAGDSSPEPEESAPEPETGERSDGEKPGDPEQEEPSGEPGPEPEESAPEADGSGLEPEESAPKPEDGASGDSGGEPGEDGSDAPGGDRQGGHPRGDDFDPPEEPDLDPELEAILESAEEELARIESDTEREEKLREREAVPEVDFDRITKELSRDIHHDVRLVTEVAHPDPSYQNLVQNQAGLIRRLVDEIRKTLEYQRSVPRRALKKGRLDPGALWKVRLPDLELFCRTEEPGDVPALAVCLLMDCSGSMGLRGKIKHARSATCALHEMCNALKVAHCVVGFSTMRGPAVLHRRAVDWARSDGAGIASLDAGGANRDGYSIRVAARELAARPEPKKVLVVLSDGLPNDDYDPRYRGEAAFTDTARAVREVERAGVGVVGIYFGDERDLPRARAMYNHLVYVHEVDRLPVILGRVLKKVITSG